MGVTISLFAPVALELWVGAAPALQISVVNILTCAFICISVGWMPAAAFQAHGLQHIQTRLMAAAFLIGSALILFLSPLIGVVSLSLIWLMHGVLQLTLLPCIFFRVSNLRPQREELLSFFVVPVLAVLSILFYQKYQPHILIILLVQIPCVFQIFRGLHGLLKFEVAHR